MADPNPNRDRQHEHRDRFWYGWVLGFAAGVFGALLILGSIL